jgi:acetate kinase
MVANGGSSSLKCQLFEMPDETVAAKANVERVGSDNALVRWTDRTGQSHEAETPLPNAEAAVRFILEKLTDPAHGVLNDLAELDAVGFKPVCAVGYSGCQYLDEPVLEATAEALKYISPLHAEVCNNAVRSFRAVLPNTPMIGLFDDFFSQEWPDYVRLSAIPWDWTEKYNIHRWMGHSTSHYYVNRRIAHLLGKRPEDINAVQLHLGGSSSVTAVRRGTSFDGDGLPSSVRSVEMDPYLITFLEKKGEGANDQIVHRMMYEGGLAAVSGIGFDMRDLQEAAEKGHKRAKLAIDTYVYHIRKKLGSLMFALENVDVITVAGGTGEASSHIRRLVFQKLEAFGIVLDDARNEACIKKEAQISADGSKTSIWVVSTNEEIVIARECAKLLAKR